MSINSRLNKMEERLKEAGLFLTPEQEQMIREVLERAHQRDPAVIRADGTVDLTPLTDAELIELARLYG